MTNSRFSNWSIDGLARFIPVLGTGRRSVLEISTPIDEAELSWEQTHKNPENWSMARKLMYCIVPVGTTFTSSLAITIISPAGAQLIHDSTHNPFLYDLPTVIYIGVAGMGLITGSLFSDIIRKQWLLMGALVSFGLFSMASGLSQNLVSIIIFRGLAGFASALIMTLSLSILYDIYPRYHRLFPCLIIASSYTIPSAFGPCIGYLISTRFNWAYAEYFISLLIAPIIIINFFTGETCAWRIGQTENIVVDEMGSVSTKLGDILVTLRQFHVVVLCIWTSIPVGVLYSFYITLPVYFDTIYKLDGLSSYLVLASLGLGSLLGLFMHSIGQQQLRSWMQYYNRACACRTWSSNTDMSRYALVSALAVCFAFPSMLVFFTFTFVPANALFISLGMLTILSGCASIALFSVLHYLSQQVDAHEAIVLSTSAGVILLLASVVAGITCHYSHSFGLRVYDILCCISVGSLPLVFVVWFLDGRQYRRQIQKEVLISNETSTHFSSKS